MRLLLLLIATHCFARTLTITERFFSFATTFDIEEAGQPIGSIHKEILSFTNSFELKDLTGAPLARASDSFFHWGTVAEVIDINGQKTGRIEEQVFRFWPWPEYRLFSPEGNLIATAQMNFLGTEFIVADPHDQSTVATLSRPLLRLFTDHWTLDIAQEQIDLKLLLLLAAYQTDKDNRWRTQQQIIDQAFSNQNN